MSGTIRRYFECKIDGHNKFWEIEYTETGWMYTTYWGSIGSKASKKTKDISSTQRYNNRNDRFIQSLIAKKIDKGYREVKTKPTVNIPIPKQEPTAGSWEIF